MTKSDFDTFDALDNRKTVYRLFERMGHGLPEDLARSRRAGFLQGLLILSGNGFSERPMVVEPCSPGEAYHLFVAITNALGVPIETAAILLEEVIRKEERVHHLVDPQWYLETAEAKG